MSSAPKQDASALPDLSVCEREPIHAPGSIEPNGALLVVQEPGLEIMQASGNAAIVLGTEAEALLGRSLDQVFEPESFASLRLWISTENLNGKRKYLSGMRVVGLQRTFDASIHRHQGVLVVELEAAIAEADKARHPHFYASLAAALAALDGRLSLSELSQRVTCHFRGLTGFDRVMVYQFLEDDSGWVIAEDCRDDMTPYLGLRYPTSDIPAQARQLYLSNTLRLKGDVNAVRVPLVPPLNPLTGQSLDMSYCVLRAMSPVHVEYLRNMGVTASMSVSIVKDERLWGLIACHHTTAKTVPHEIRISCEVLARVFSAHIAAAQEEDKRRHESVIVEFRDQLSERLRAQPDVSKTLLEGERLASVINSKGAAVCIGGKVALIGVTPSRHEVEGLVQWLDSYQQRYIFYTDKLSEQCPSSEAFSEVASGLLSSRIALGSRDFILWFRPSALMVVEWAGNPAKPVEETEAGKRISPRLSFERWKETIGDRSEPWRDYEREFALSLRQSVAEVLLVRKNEEITRLNHELERSNIELDSFAYAASHDLQEPVRTVRAYAQLLNRRSGATLDDQARQLVQVIENSALRMGNLISALLTYGQVGGGRLRERKPVNFEDILRLAIMNLGELIRASDAIITHDPLPTVSADPEQMMQLLQNLVGNSIKYCRPNEFPQVHVSATMQNQVWSFSVEDNGEGFQPEEADLIFAAFKRLHGRDIPGTGIGLALCRRIVEHHSGRIWAESKGCGHGASFWFTLPQT
jgi:chemotaxis family two-component system sensor kinase Cph1